MLLDRSLSRYQIAANQPLKQALLQLDHEKLRILVCLDADGRLAGVLTLGDINRWLLSEKTTR